MSGDVGADEAGDLLGGVYGIPAAGVLYGENVVGWTRGWASASIGGIECLGVTADRRSKADLDGEDDGQPN